MREEDFNVLFLEVGRRKNIYNYKGNMKWRHDSEIQKVTRWRFSDSDTIKNAWEKNIAHSFEKEYHDIFSN